MTVAESLYSQLSGDTAIVALVDDRIYAMEATTPSSRTTLVYQFPETNWEYVLNNGGAIVRATLDIRCWAGSIAAAHVLALAVRASISPKFSGVDICQLVSRAEKKTALTADKSVFEVLSTFALIYAE